MMPVPQGKFSLRRGRPSADVDCTARPWLTLSGAHLVIALCHSSYLNSESWQLAALVQLPRERSSAGNRLK